MQRNVEATSGAKAAQRSDTENRAWQYGRWHRTQDRRFYAQDIDSIEFGYDEHGARHPLALIEVTRINSDTPPSAAYRKAVLARFLDRDTQGEFARQVAGLLNIPAFLCLYRVPADNSERVLDFWLYKFSGDPWTVGGDGWAYFTPDEYSAFLKKLRVRRGLVYGGSK